jgi:hypothetical protein
LTTWSYGGRRRARDRLAQRGDEAERILGALQGGAGGGLEVGVGGGEPAPHRVERLVRALAAGVEAGAVARAVARGVEGGLVALEPEAPDAATISLRASSSRPLRPRSAAEPAWSAMRSTPSVNASSAGTRPTITSFHTNVQWRGLSRSTHDGPVSMLVTSTSP